ncbi:MAG: DUF4157 domain-containing protein [Lachnospiraceae bacterium]|nr:DUF4157 domain-containing protein [Lachnospiraceae bacterium]
MSIYAQEKRKEERKRNETGLSDSVKAALEQKTGFSADDVRVYRNSPAPARVGALAISVGSDICLGPGGDGALMHELGHWVQKKMGRVRPTKMENGYPVNDDPALEEEADRFRL